MSESSTEKIRLIPELKFDSHAPEVWNKLGEISRTGWVIRGVEHPETVQEHTVSLRILANELSDSLDNFSEDDKQDLLDMLEVHDWPEAIVGDEVVLDDGSQEKRKLKDEKSKRELDAMQNICKAIVKDGDQVLKLWLRFEEGADKVASLARQLDKYQAVEKALEYEKEQMIALFQEFKNYSQKYITNPVLVERMNKLEI